MNDSLDRMDFVEQLHSSSCIEADKRFDRITPLFQRVLSALIMEDEIEESEDTGFGRQRVSVNDSCFLSSSESKPMDNVGFCQPVFGVQTRKNGNVHKIFPCNGNMDNDRNAGALDRICNGELMQRDMYSEVELEVRLSRSDHIAQSLQTKNTGVSSSDFQFEQMGVEEKLVVELQHLDLLLEDVVSFSSWTVGLEYKFFLFFFNPRVMFFLGF